MEVSGPKKINSIIEFSPTCQHIYFSTSVHLATSSDSDLCISMLTLSTARLICKCQVLEVRALLLLLSVVLFNVMCFET